MDLKYVPLMLNILDINMDDRSLIRHIDNKSVRNLIMLSIINEDVRNVIVDKIQKTEYTRYLLKKIKLNSFINEFNQQSYLEFSFATNSFKNLLNCLDYNVLYEERFFNDNNILHLIALLFNNKTVANEINFNEINKPENMYVLSKLAFTKNKFDLIPIEMINHYDFDEKLYDKFHIFYTFDPVDSISKLNQSHLNFTPKLLKNIYENMNKSQQNEFKLVILNNFNEYLKFYSMKDKTELEQVKDFVKNIYEEYGEKINNSIHILPYFSKEHMDIYNIYVNDYNVYTMESILNYEYYDIHVAKDKDYTYMCNIFKNNKDKFTEILCERLFKYKAYTFEEYSDIITFIEKYYNLNNVDTNILKLLLLTSIKQFNIQEYDKVNFQQLYKYVIDYGKHIVLNMEVMTKIIHNIIQYIDSNTSFQIILKNTSKSAVLFNSKLNLETKFGNSDETILASLEYLNNENMMEVIYDVEDTNKYLTENKDLFHKLYFEYKENLYTKIDVIHKIFNISQEFYIDNKFQEDFKNVFFNLQGITKYKDWVNVFIKNVRLTKEFFTKEECSKLIMFPYEIQELFIKHDYINLKYMDTRSYHRFIDLASENIIKGNFYETLTLIDYKYFLESENLINVLINYEDIDKLFLNNEYINSIKTGIIKNKDTFLRKLINCSKKSIYYLGINNCFPHDLYLSSNNTFILKLTLKYILDNNIKLSDILDKLIDLSKMNNQIMRHILVFLITNFDGKIITNYFDLINIKSYEVMEYINTFAIIENENTYKTILNYFKYDKDIQTHVAIINKPLFMKDSNKFSMDDKLTILIDNYTKFEKLFIDEFIDNIKTRNINPEKLIELFTLYELEPQSKIIELYPELINYTELPVELIDEVIKKSIDDETIINNLISFNGNSSEYVINKLLMTFIKIDFEIYMKIVSKFAKSVDIDTKDILTECKNNSNLFNLLLKDKFFKTEDLQQVIKIKNNTNTFTLTQCEENVILDNLHYLNKEDMIEHNIFGFPNLFTLCITEKVTKKLLERFKPTDPDISNMVDKLGRNIYSYCAQFGMYDMIPKDNITYDFILRIIINTKSDSQLKKYLDKIIKEPVFNEVDKENNNLMMQMVKYRPSLFKTYYGGTYFTKLVELLGNINSNNETYLMNLIKYSEEPDIMFVLNKILSGKILKLNMLYVDNNYGSVLTYALKYSQDFAKKLINNSIINDVINQLSYVYDTVPIMINPYSATCYEKNSRLNLLQISALYDHTVLRTLMKNINRKRVMNMMKEVISCEDKDLNLLAIAINNNPESVQEILCNVLCDDKYIETTEEVYGNFEEVSEIQPGSFYYLQNSTKSSHRIKLNMDYHYYGYNFKNKITSNNIKHVTHYILDKQEIGSKNNVCQICMNYKQKVVLTKCRHKICIVCALKTKNCQTCRTPCDEKDKILI